MRLAFGLGCAVLAACVGDSTVSGDGGSDATVDVATDAMAPPDVLADTQQTDAGGNPDADAAVFSPKSLSGLALWLVGGVGVTHDTSNNVTVWADQSGNGNDAKPGGTEPAQPQYVSVATGGLPAVRFTGGAHLDVADAPSLQVGTGDFLLTVVLRHNTVPGNVPQAAIIVAKQAAGSPYPGVAMWADFPTGSGALGGQLQSGIFWTWTSESTLNDDMPRVFGLYRAGPKLATRLNGADDQALAADAGNAALINCSNNLPLHIGANDSGAQAISGDLSEIVLVVGTTPTAQLTALEGYLKSKYGL